jgi:hypothetical protein
MKKSYNNLDSIKNKNRQEITFLNKKNKLIKQLARLQKHKNIKVKY